MANSWNGKPYYSFDAMLKERFSTKVYKVALNGGMSCPNRDGTLGNGGCIFCSAGGSGDFAASRQLSITEQIEEGKQLLAGKRLSGKLEVGSKESPDALLYRLFSGIYRYLRPY